METFDEKDIINNRFFELWLDIGEGYKKYAEVKTTKATTKVTTEKFPIAGRMGKASRVTGTEGDGSMSFYECLNGLNEAVNETLKAGKTFFFDLIGVQNDPVVDGEKRTTIEDCVLTEYNPIDIDIEKFGEQSFTFEYNPDKVS